MRSCSPPAIVERARPLLGTRVAIRVRGLPLAAAHAAIDAAFAEIGLVHDRMSFQAPGSDVSHLNRQAFRRPVAVDRRCMAVLRRARAVAAASGGCFDITAAVTRAVPRGSWRDIELCPNGTVRFHRPVQIDPSGIAKGYAVDRAIAVLRRHGVVQACVNAGGDLRLFGPDAEPILLRTPSTDDRCPAAIELQNGSLASSVGRRRADGARRFASVVAPCCVIADALTKVVLAQGEAGAPVLRRFGAVAYLHAPGQGWRCIGATV